MQLLQSSEVDITITARAEDRRVDISFEKIEKILTEMTHQLIVEMNND